MLSDTAQSTSGTSMEAAATYFARLDQAPPAVRLQHLIAGSWISQAIAAAAELPIADLLATGPRPCVELAEVTGTDTSALYRLLRALASVGIFTEVVPRTFGLTPMADVLRTNAPASLRNLAHVAEGPQECLEEAALRSRCDAIGRDMFVDVPCGGDAYLLSHIIHDWDDEHAIAILRNCRRAMGMAGRLLLIEEVIPPGDAPSYGKLSDLNMLVFPGGQERTTDEYRALLVAADFTLDRIIATRSRVSLLEATPTQGPLA
jgi:hypothetical protein